MHTVAESRLKEHTLIDATIKADAYRGHKGEKPPSESYLCCKILILVYEFYILVLLRQVRVHTLVHKRMTARIYKIAVSE